jgi:hypothetical protein
MPCNPEDLAKSVFIQKARGRGPKKRKRLLTEEVVSSEDKTLDVTPINQADPPVTKEPNTIVVEDMDDLAEGAGRNDAENLEHSPKRLSHGKCLS